MRDEPHRIPRSSGPEVLFKEIRSDRLDRLWQALTYLAWALCAAVWIGSAWAGWQFIGRPVFEWMGSQ